MPSRRGVRAISSRLTWRTEPPAAVVRLVGRTTALFEIGDTQLRRQVDVSACRDSTSVVKETV
jgi:hypothetical protein